VAAAFLPGVLAQQSAVTGARAQVGAGTGAAAGVLAGIPAQTMALAGLGVGIIGALLNLVYTTICAPISSVIGAVLGLCGISGLLGGSGLCGILGGSGLCGILGGSGLAGLCGVLAGLCGVSGLTGLCGNLGLGGILGGSGLGGLIGLLGTSGIIGICAACVTGALAVCVGSPIFKICATILILVGRLIAYAIAWIVEGFGAACSVIFGCLGICLDVPIMVWNLIVEGCNFVPCLGWLCNCIGCPASICSNIGSCLVNLNTLCSLCVLDGTTLLTGWADLLAALGVLCGNVITQCTALVGCAEGIAGWCTTLLYAVRCIPCVGWLPYIFLVPTLGSVVGFIVYTNLFVSILSRCVTCISGICGIPHTLIQEIVMDLCNICGVWCCL